MVRTEDILVAGRQCVAGGQNVLQLSFSAPFLWFFDFVELVSPKTSPVLWTNKERIKEILE